MKKLIGQKIEVRKFDDKGDMTEEVLVKGYYEGEAKELIRANTGFGSAVTSYSVALIRTQTDGVTKLVKAPFEVCVFPNA